LEKDSAHVFLLFDDLFLFTCNRGMVNKWLPNASSCPLRVALEGRPLSARTVGHAHRVLHKALARAVENETLARNVASLINPPQVETQETEILSAEQMADVLAKLDGHALYPIVVLALATGMRRGELLALRWEDLDLERATVSIARFFEETKAGLRFKAPKTKRGYRTISLPPSSIETLRALRRQQLELRMALGQGRPESGALVFSTIEGGALSPDNLSRDGGA
jgi:integrase